MKLEFHPEAEEELIESAAYYELRVTGLGHQLEAEMLRATSLLLSQPHLGKPVVGTLRQFALNRFPFTLYYTIAENVLRIEAVAHQRRLPGYWRARIGSVN